MYQTNAPYVNSVTLLYASKLAYLLAGEWIRKGKSLLIFFCLSSIDLPLFDDANKITPLNIEKALQFQLFPNIWDRQTKTVSEKFSLKNSMCELINAFAT